jgi:hypothetical protein
MPANAQAPTYTYGVTQHSNPFDQSFGVAAAPASGQGLQYPLPRQPDISRREPYQSTPAPQGSEAVLSIIRGFNPEAVDKALEEQKKPGAFASTYNPLRTQSGNGYHEGN